MDEEDNNDSDLYNLDDDDDNVESYTLNDNVCCCSFVDYSGNSRSVLFDVSTMIIYIVG